MRKTTMFAALAAVAFPPMLAMAEDAEIRFGAGKEGGGYDRAVQEIVSTVNRRPGMTANVENFPGSEDIVIALCAGNIDIAPAQSDAAWAFAEAGGCVVEPVALYGMEYAMLWFPPDSDNDELSDLDKGDTIVTGTLGSGAALTLDTMIKIERGPDGNMSDWQEAKVSRTGITGGLAKAAVNPNVSVFMVVTLGHPDVAKFLSKGWTLGELYDKDLNDLEVNGRSLYESVEVEVGDQEDYVYEVPSVFYAAQGFGSQHPQVVTLIERVGSAFVQ